MNSEELHIELVRIKSALDPTTEVEKLQEFLRLEETEWSEAALSFIQDYYLPALMGVDLSGASIPFSIAIRLFRVGQDISWGKWPTFFPDSKIEVREDKEQGNTLLYGLPYKAEWAKEKKAGVFYSPNGFNDKPTAGHTSCRSEDNVKSFNALWADYDVGEAGKEEALSKIAHLPLPPSIVVETRNGFHVLYRLKGEWTLEDWKKVQARLVDETKTDPACKDAPRLLRVPGSWHCKDMWTGGDPYLVKMIYFSEVRYPRETFLKTYATTTPTTKNQYGNKEFDDRPRYKTIRVPVPDSLGKGERHGTLMEEAGRIYAHIDESKASDARAMLKEWYRRSSAPLKNGWEKEADMVISWVEQREFGHEVSR